MKTADMEQTSGLGVGRDANKPSYNITNILWILGFHKSRIYLLLSNSTNKQLTAILGRGGGAGDDTWRSGSKLLATGPGLVSSNCPISLNTDAVNASGCSPCSIKYLRKQTIKFTQSTVAKIHRAMNNKTVLEYAHAFLVNSKLLIKDYITYLTLTISVFNYINHVVSISSLSKLALW